MKAKVADAIGRAPTLEPIKVDHMLFPTGDQVITRGRPDLHRKLTSRTIADPTIDLAGRPDSAVLLEIVAVGDGSIFNGKHNPMPVKVGDIAVANGFMRGSIAMVEKKPFYLYPSEWLMATIDVEAGKLTMLPGHLLTKVNDEAMRLVVAGGEISTTAEARRRTGKKSVKLHTPINDPENNGGDGFNEDGGRDPDKVVYEEVIDPGEGMLLADGTKQKALWSKGDLVAFTHAAAALRILVHAENFTIVPWSHVRFAIRQGQKVIESKSST